MRRKRGKGISKTTQQHEHREQAADDTTPPSGGDKCTPHVLATFLQGVTLSSPSLRPSFLSIAHSVRFLPFFFLSCLLSLSCCCYLYPQLSSISFFYPFSLSLPVFQRYFLSHPPLPSHTISIFSLLITFLHSFLLLAFSFPK